MKKLGLAIINFVLGVISLIIIGVVLSCIVCAIDGDTSDILSGVIGVFVLGLLAYLLSRLKNKLTGRKD